MSWTLYSVKKKHTRGHSVWFHFYEQEKQIHGDGSQNTDYL